jgi:hypothetical protein
MQFVAPSGMLFQMALCLRKTGSCALAVSLAVVLLVVFPKDVRAADATPRASAATLVARLQAESSREHMSSFATSGVIARKQGLWLVVGSTASPISYMGGGPARTRVRIYRWLGSRWSLRGTVSRRHRNDLSPSQWIHAVSLTRSIAPDFAIEGCGAGDANCLSIVSYVGGHWHALPFEYGYGQTMEVNALPVSDHLVQTEVDACGCAGGPTTLTYERYENGAFRPARRRSRVRRLDLPRPRKFL